MTVRFPGKEAVQTWASAEPLVEFFRKQEEETEARRLALPDLREPGMTMTSLSATSYGYTIGAEIWINDRDGGNARTIIRLTNNQGMITDRSEVNDTVFLVRGRLERQALSELLTAIAGRLSDPELK